jgi:hypothetical protein
LATFIKLLKTVSKYLFMNISQNRCHTFLDCLHVCKTCAIREALQAGKQKEVHRTSLVWRLFPRLKSITNGARFADVAAIQERVTAVLRSIPKKAFTDSFQKLY